MLLMREKLISLLVLVFLVSLTLSGCGGSSSSGGKTDEKTITFWTPLTGDDGAYMDEMVKAYNATNPKFKVKHVVTSDMYTKIFTVMNSGKGIPDLAIIHADRVPGFVDKDMLEPLTDIMSAQPSINGDNYIPQAWNAGTVNGTQYTVPLDIHSNAMYYNKDLLEQYGVSNFLDDNVITFDEMLSLKGKLKKGDYVVNDALISWVILAQIQNLGGDIKDANENPTVNTPEMKQAIEEIKKISDAGLMTPYGEDGYLMFQSGHVLFSTDGTWTSTAHAQVKGLNFGVTNIYSFDPAVFHNRASSHMFAMLKNDARSDEKEKGIADFLEWVRNNSIKWAEAGQIVASKVVFDSPEYQKYIQSFFTSSEAETNSLYIYTYKYYPEVQEALDTYSADMVHGKLDIDKGLKQAQKFVDDKIKEDTSGKSKK